MQIKNRIPNQKIIQTTPISHQKPLQLTPVPPLIPTKEESHPLLHPTHTVRKKNHHLPHKKRGNLILFIFFKTPYNYSLSLNSM